MDKNNYISRYTSKEAEMYGADILKGLKKLMENKNTPLIYNELKQTLDLIWDNREKINWDDVKKLQYYIKKQYNE